MKIGGNDDFTLKNPFEKNAMQPNSPENEPKQAGAKNVDGFDNAGKVAKPNEIHKPAIEEGATGKAGEENPNAKLDKNQFTDENEIQEIDLEQFEDDFE